MLNARQQVAHRVEYRGMLTFLLSHVLGQKVCSVQVRGGLWAAGLWGGGSPCGEANLPAPTPPAPRLLLWPGRGARGQLPAGPELAARAFLRATGVAGLCPEASKPQPSH